MKAFIAIVKTAGTKVTKYQQFDTEAEAEAHVSVYGGFAASNPGGLLDFWVANSGSKTLTHDADAQQASKTAEAWANLRTNRDNKLNETDFHAVADRTIPQTMKDYRQALRDLPANTSDPTNPTWPTKPS